MKRDDHSTTMIHLCDALERNAVVGFVGFGPPIATRDGFKIESTIVAPGPLMKACLKAMEECHEFQSDLRFDFNRYVRQFAEEQGLLSKTDEVKP